MFSGFLHIFFCCLIDFSLFFCCFTFGGVGVNGYKDMKNRRAASVSVSAQDGIITLRKAHTHILPSISAVSPRLPLKQCQCLVEHRLFLTLEGGMSAASFLHSSFLQVINAVMLWPVHVQKVPQASEHLCPAKLQTRCEEHWTEPYCIVMFQGRLCLSIYIVL